MFEFIAHVILFYQFNTTPLEAIFFSAPHPSVQLLYFPDSPELTQKLLDFARSRPYADSIPNWWSEQQITTEMLGQKIQELEHDNKSLPDLSDRDRFKISNEEIYKTVNHWWEYKKRLLSVYPFLLDNERKLIDDVVKMVDQAANSYYQLAYSRDSYHDEITKRKYLEEVKRLIGNDFYNKGILPALSPVFENFP